MPKHIADGDGKRVRYWTDEEIRARYRQGYVDAGGKINSSAGYTEADLKEAYKKGFEISDRMIGAAARAGYEEGHNEGEESGKKLGERAATRNIHDRIRAAIRQGYEDGYRDGCKASKNDIFKSGLETGKREVIKDSNEKIKAIEARFNQEKDTIGQKAVHDYKESRFFFNRVDSFLGKFKPNYIATQLRHGFSAIGNIELGQIQVKNNEPNSPFNYKLETLRIRQFSRYSGKVISVISSRFLLPVFTISISAAVCSMFLSDRLREHYADREQKSEQYKHGETKSQYESRVNVQEKCQKLRTIDPTLFGLSKTDKAFQLKKESCLDKYDVADKLYKHMIETMRLRRIANVDNQILFGLRHTALHHDKLSLEGDVIIAKEDITKEIDDTLQELVQHGLKKF